MTLWLLLLVPLITCSYAAYEIRRSRRVRGLGVAVLATAAVFVFSLFGLEQLLISLHTPSSFDPLGDGIGLALAAIYIRGIAAVLHFVVLGLLMYCADPDIPEQDA